MLDGDDLRRKPYVERKAALRKLLRHGRDIQYVEHAEGLGHKLFATTCHLESGTCSSSAIVQPRAARAILICIHSIGHRRLTRTCDGIACRDMSRANFPAFFEVPGTRREGTSFPIGES